MSYSIKDDHNTFASAVVEAVEREDITSLKLLAKIAKQQGFDEDAEDIMKEVEYLQREPIEDKSPRLTANDVL